MGGLIVLALLVMALLAPVIAPYEPRQIIREAHKSPRVCAAGLDYLLALTMSGAISSAYHPWRPYLPVRWGRRRPDRVTAGSSSGMASAYAGGSGRLVVQRIVDVMMAVPGLIIVLAIIGRPGLVVEQRHIASSSAMLALWSAPSDPRSCP